MGRDLTLRAEGQGFKPGWSNKLIFLSSLVEIEVITMFVLLTLQVEDLEMDLSAERNRSQELAGRKWELEVQIGHLRSNRGQVRGEGGEKGG